MCSFLFQSELITSWKSTSSVHIRTTSRGYSLYPRRCAQDFLSSFLSPLGTYLGSIPYVFSRLVAVSRRFGARGALAELARLRDEELFSVAAGAIHELFWCSNSLQFLCFALRCTARLPECFEMPPRASICSGRARCADAQLSATRRRADFHSSTSLASCFRTAVDARFRFEEHLGRHSSSLSFGGEDFVDFSESSSSLVSLLSQ